MRVINVKSGQHTVIPLDSREASLKRKIRLHLYTLGFRKSDQGTLEITGRDKDAIRATHSSQRRDRLATNASFLLQRAPTLFKYFASGREVDPESISPVLERIVASTWQADLFRLASLTWSIPVSNGYGRRLRYLVWDAHNDKLIGLIAIGDPVFNLSVRDKLIGWDVHDRGARLVNMMDAYVLGALPGQPHIKSLSHQYLISEAIVQCRPDTLLPDADLRRLTLQKIDRHMPNHSHIVRCITPTNPTLVFPKRHIQSPVQLILDSPV